MDEVGNIIEFFLSPAGGLVAGVLTFLFDSISGVFDVLGSLFKLIDL